MVEKKLDFTQLNTKISTVKDRKSFEHFFFVSNIRLINSSNKNINRKEISETLPDHLVSKISNQHAKILLVASFQTCIYISPKKKALNLLDKKSSIYMIRSNDIHFKILAYNNLKPAIKNRVIILN